MFECCRARSDEPSGPFHTIVLNSLGGPASRQDAISDHLRQQIPGGQLLSISPSAQYLPGEMVPTSSKYTSPGALIQRVGNMASSPDHDRMAVVKLNDFWQTQHAAIGSAAQKAKRPCVSAFVFTPLAKSLAAAKEPKDKLQTILHYALLHRGEETKAQGEPLEVLSKRGLELALSGIHNSLSKDAPPTSGIEDLHGVQKEFVLSLLGLSGGKHRANIYPRHSYDLNVKDQSPEAGATQILQFAQGHPLGGSALLFLSGPQTVSSSPVCEHCRKGHTGSSKAWNHIDNPNTVATTVSDCGGCLKAALPLALNGSNLSAVEQYSVSPNRLDLKPSRTWDQNWDGMQGKGKGMAFIFLVRHGQYESHHSPLDERHTLTELGLKQAALSGHHVKKMVKSVDSIISSDMTRAMQTAQALKTELGHTGEVEIDPLLAEAYPCDPQPAISPEWVAQTPDFAKSSDPSRVEEAFHKYFHRNTTSSEPTRKVLVCHMNIAGFLLLRALQIHPQSFMTLQIAHATVIPISIDPRGYPSIMLGWSEMANHGLASYNNIP